MDSGRSVARSLRAALRPLRVAWLVVLLAGSAAHAQICRAELDQALTASDDPSVVTGRDAAVALHRAVTLAEPAMPAFVRVAEAPLDAGHEAFEEVLFLAERRLLPPGWTPDALTPGVWREMVGRFLAWYALPGEPAALVPDDDAALVEALGSVLQRVGSAIRPAALVATSPDAPGGVAFRALIWNWTSYPRLLVFRPDPGVADGEDVAAAVRSLENCVRTIRHWFVAPEATARDLFLAHNDARMIVVGSDPARPRMWPWFVDRGAEVDVFTFDHPLVEELEAYSAVFAGPQLALPRLLRLLPSIRTNVSPVGLPRYLQTPP